MADRPNPFFAPEPPGPAAGAGDPAGRLPELLRAVRWRRRRRQLRRAALGALLLLGGVALWPDPRPDDLPVAPPAAPPWTVVRDDPGAVARHAVTARIDPAWFVDDHELQSLLRESGLPIGTVRIGHTVQVAAVEVAAAGRNRP